MRWLALALVGVSLPVAFVGNAGMLVSWPLATLGFVLLSRDASLRRASRFALLTLAIAILAVLLVAGTIVGFAGDPLVQLPESVGQNAEIVIEFVGFLGAWLATGVLLLAAPGLARPAKTTLATALLAVPTLMTLTVVDLVPEGILVVLLPLTGIFVLAAFARFAWGALRKVDIASPASA